jgi:Leucine-rich repeat (LRR) protein
VTIIFANASATDVEDLHCDYLLWTDSVWPTHQICRVINVDLSFTQIDKKFNFSGSYQQKNDTRSVYFTKLPEVYFIPNDIFREFPSLNGLGVLESDMDVVKDDLFSSDFVNIEFLYLGRNKITTIESEAFYELINLKWLALWRNRIVELHLPLFKTNHKLERIGLSFNKITMIHPNLFKKLKHLKLVELSLNSCVNKDFGCAKNCSVTKNELDKSLWGCYANCRLDGECSSPFLEGRTIEKIAELKRDQRKIWSKVQQQQSTLTSIQRQLDELTLSLEAVSNQTTSLSKIGQDFKKLEKKVEDMTQCSCDLS